MSDIDLAESLQRFLIAQGCEGEVLGEVAAIPEGHAGLAHSLDLAFPGGRVESYVLKLAPAGVRRSGSTDIYRQFPLLRRLAELDLPVPRVPWASASEEWLGAPFIIMERLPGRSLIVWEPGIAGDLSGYWLEAARLLGLMHTRATEASLSKWEKPFALHADLERWTRLIRHTASSADSAAAAELAVTLQCAVPEVARVGLVHGDFQPGNVLYVDGKASALIDWDLAAVGPVAIDLGWLLMMADPKAWAGDWQPIGPPARSDLIAAYGSSGGQVDRSLDWYQAFGCFRMAVITGMNVKLHRENRRRDPIWEKFASSASTLLARGAAILKEGSGEP